MSTDTTALLTHFAHSEPAFIDGEFVRPEPTPGCDHCEAAGYLPEIHAAWTSGNPVARQMLWSMQDGYGTPGATPPQGMDWSGVRDSTPGTVRAMWVALHA
jgi:hypothetical protein